jgi:hypothetical protein
MSQCLVWAHSQVGLQVCPIVCMALTPYTIEAPPGWRAVCAAFNGAPLSLCSSSCQCCHCRTCQSGLTRLFSLPLCISLSCTQNWLPGGRGRGLALCLLGFTFGPMARFRSLAQELVYSRRFLASHQPCSSFLCLYLWRCSSQPSIGELGIDQSQSPPILPPLSCLPPSLHVHYIH